MSIHAISGKPGGGKTMYSVKLILHELLYGSRVIITNVGLLAGEINAYIQKNYPNKSVNLFERLILIDEEQMGVFFTIRPPGSRGPVMLTKEQWQAGKMPDYSGVTDKGVMYVLDEIHIKFNARAWMETGRDVLFYLSQHRKLGDTVICITQAIGNVDKQFRSVTQDYTYIRNLGKERMSKFRLPSMFIRQTYNTPATDTTVPMETGSFRLDVTGLASLYDTAKGVSIHGRAGADKDERKTGLHWGVGVALIIAAVILFWRVGPPLLASVFKTPQRVEAKAIAAVSSVLPKKETKLVPKLKPEPEQICYVATNETSHVQCLGFDRLSGYYRIHLSDGRVIYQGDPKLEEINPGQYVKYNGKEILFRRVEAVEFREATIHAPPIEIENQPAPRIKVVPGENWKRYNQ